MKINKHFENFIFNVNTRFQYLMGGFGSSKSYSIAQKILLRCLTKKNYRVAIVRNNFSTHKNTTFKLMKDLCKQFTHIKSTGTADIFFNNGSEIIFLGAEDEEKLKSLVSIDLIWCEELTEISESSFTQIISRQRGVENPELIMSTNPLTTHHWMYKIFFDKSNLTPHDFYGKEFIHDSILGRCYYNHSTVLDNAFVGKGYVDSLKKLKLIDNFKYLCGFLGHFGTLGDLVFPNHKIATIDNFRGETLFGLDLGFSVSYNCCLRAILRNKTLYITHEYYSKGKLTRELANDIRQWSTLHKFNLGTIWSDHSPQILAELRSLNVNSVNAEKLGKVEGFHRIREYEIVIHPRCKQLIADLSTFEYKEIKGVKYEDKFSFDSHCADALSYLLSYKKANNYKGSSQFKTNSVPMPKY